ncbi:MAG: PorT family protein [Tidjanibacter sp.]|nr:PorT family protein [Tidjanibacter sp.]
MKKVILSIVAALLSCSAMMAGNNILGILNVGGRIGIVSSSEQIPDTTDALKNAITAQGTGWTGTVFARVNIPKLPLYIQPELQYTNSQIKVPTLPSVDELLGGKTESEETVTNTYIDLPVLIGAEIGLGGLASVRVNAGPVVSIAQNKGFKELTENDFLNAWDKLKKDPTVTWTAGVGVKVLSLIAEIRYNGNFKGGKVDTENLQESIDPNRTSWNLSLGVMF